MTTDVQARLAQKRANIGKAQTDIWGAVGRRLMETREVGAIKAAAGMPPVDPEREAQLLDAAPGEAREHGVPPVLARRLLRVILDYAVEEHKAISDGVPIADLPDYIPPSASMSEMPSS